MIAVRKSEERGHADHGWLDARHSFSFADYHDRQHMGFRSLRVINEDRVAVGGGFGLHPHRDMEIVTYVVSGELRHRDSLGNTAVMRAGDVQRISAGTGIQHSEVNDSPAEPVHLLQIWITPERPGATPAYGEKSFAQAAPGTLHPIASRDGRDGSLPINQDAAIYLGRLGAGQALRHPVAAGRALWLQVVKGAVEADGVSLRAGDGAAVTDVAELALSAAAPTDFLLFDLN